MIIDIHILQSFGPSNLNRDDTGSPKDCIFGGVRRSRVSSQCIKRSIRRHEAFASRVEAAGGDLGTRTKLVAGEIASVLTDKHGLAQEDAERLGYLGVRAIGPKFDKKKTNRTQYLLYVGAKEVELIAEALMDSEIVDALLVHAPRDSSADIPKDMSDQFKSLEKSLKSLVSKTALENRATSADIAMFGRMVADAPHMQIEAASQVAHAISTHEVETIMDYYTAVDDVDRQGSEQTGAGMVGITELNSACYYRYANIDLDQLARNLAFNMDLRNGTVLGFIESAIRAVPTGKQNSTAPQNPPFAVKVVLRKDGFPWSLVGAFSAPIRFEEAGSIEELSLKRMNEYYDQLKATYGNDGIVYEDGFVLGGHGSFQTLLSDLSAQLKEPAEVS